jgi:flavin-binding protein dodecin
MTVAKIVELSAESHRDFSDAVMLGIERARKTLDGVNGAWIENQEVRIGNDGRLTYRVYMKVTFVMRE